MARRTTRLGFFATRTFNLRGMSDARGAACCQSKSKGRALARAALDAYLSALRLYQPFHQRQPQTRALRLVTDAIEPAEYSWKVLLWYAFAGVPHAEEDAPDVLACFDRYSPASISMAYGVRQQVIENACDRSPIPNHP